MEGHKNSGQSASSLTKREYAAIQILAAIVHNERDATEERTLPLDDACAVIRAVQLTDLLFDELAKDERWELIDHKGQDTWSNYTPK